jgi:selenide,water dikinase
MPTFAHARAMAAAGAVSGGTSKNLATALGLTRFADDVAEADRVLLADAQTSGGLLMAVAPEKADRLVARLRQLGTPAAAVIGEVTARPGIDVVG